MRMVVRALFSRIAQYARCQRGPAFK
jgi:hypothetical protein